jgi:hypothetical protein
MQLDSCSVFALAEPLHSSLRPVFRASDVFLIHLPWQLLVPGVPGVVHVHTCTCTTSTTVMSFHDPSHPFIWYIPEYHILLVLVPRWRYRTPWYAQGYMSTFIMCWHVDIDWCQTCLWYVSAFWPVDSCLSSVRCVQCCLYWGTARNGSERLFFARVRNGSVTPREEGFAKQTQVMLLGKWCDEDVA